MSDLTVGLLVLLGVAAFTYGCFTKFRWPFGSSYEVQAVFRTAASEIKGGSPVRIAGVDAGKVVRVERAPGGTAAVTLQVKEEFRPLRADTTMKIRPRLFLEGNFFVDVRPGTPGSPELEDGGVIPLAQTANAVQIDEVLRTLQRDTRRDLQQTIANLATALDEGGARALNASFPDWFPALTGVAAVSEDLRGERPGQLSDFVAAQRRVSSAIASRNDDLAALLTNFATTVQALAASRDDVGDSVRALKTTLETAEPALRDIGNALPPVRRLVASVRPSLRLAPSSLASATPLVREAARLLQDDRLPALSRELRPAVRSLAAVTPDLRAFFDAATPVARCVTTNVLPVLRDTIQDGKFTTGEPVWKEIVRFPVGLASASQSFDANGAQIRYGAGVGENLVTTALPGAEALYSLTERPLLGARPRYTPNRVPPFRPEAPCEAQPVVDLRAAAAPAPPQRRIDLPRGQAKQAVEAATRRLRKLNQTNGLRRALRAASREDAKAAR